LVGEGREQAADEPPREVTAEAPELAAVADRIRESLAAVWAAPRPMLPLRDNVPTRTFPFVTIGLIAANALVWFWELSRPGVDVHVFRDGFYPCALHGPCQLPPGFHALPWYEGVFTGMFMHASWEHILGNMLFFWIFGNNVEDALGHVRFLVWYLAAGIAAMAAQTAVTLHFGSVADASIPNIGASGAIAGVLGAYF